jgi:(E)-4-hydroxy-3-methylbut-2-enyl-diphosphate synthase
MTSVDTNDTAACVEQIVRVRQAGGRIVRLTTQGVREAENLGNIRRELLGRGVSDVALVADVHFSPEVALAAAEHADKVRINPGNYRDAEGSRLRGLIKKCMERDVALRIGVNHGSLAPQIVERYGDTPQGMTASAMEFLRVCRSEGFDRVVVSMKSSNVRVMTAAYRLLVAAMDAEGMRYPLHLGVTEAGNAMEGRVKSSVGIAALLAEGLGDTVRVSLTEEPECEIPVAQRLVDYFAGAASSHCGSAGEAVHSAAVNPRADGQKHPPRLYSELSPGELADCRIISYDGRGPAAPYWRRAVAALDGDRPVILHRRYDEQGEALWVKAAADFGPLFLDGLADGIWIDAARNEDALALAILQAARVRISAPEYIACPGCGRTLFDLQGTLESIKQRTGHLKGLKIAVMGCIVNGPGEMADADYGYVGAAPGHVTLYRGREVVRRNIPQEEAIDALLELTGR